ncbi:MAG: PAS domain-containing protein, partial [Gammaproteobacteria bacterium]
MGETAGAQRQAGASPFTNPGTAPGVGRAEAPWGALGLLAAYRVAVGLLALGTVWGRWGWSPLGERDPGLFAAAAAVYAALGLLSVATAALHRPPARLQLHLGLLADLAALVLLAHASGGARSGLGVLLVVPLVGGGSLLGPERAVLYAALASLGLLGAEAWAWLAGLPGGPAFTQAGLVGVGCFAAAGGASLLARRARDSEALALQRGIDLANMRQLADYVVQRMQTGIVVVDGAGRIRLANDSARHLLGLGQESCQGHPLAERAPALQEALEAWRARPDLP